MSGSDDGTLRVWDTRTGRRRQTVDHRDAPGWAIRVGFAAGDRFLVVGSDRGALYRYDFRDGLLHDRVTLEDPAPDRFGPGAAWSMPSPAT